MRDIISIRDFSRKEIDEIVRGGAEFSLYLQGESCLPSGLSEIPAGTKVTLLFLEPSTRTLGSYEEAARILGLERKIISGPEATSLMKRESFANTVRMMAVQRAKILVIRTKEEGTARFATEILKKSKFGQEVSVQNAGDGSNQHPSQCFLDRLTILNELGRLENFKLGLVGDLKYSRTIHSLLSSFQREDGILITAVSCPETKLPEKLKRGLEIKESDSLEDLRCCDIVYVTRIQEERFTDPMELEQVRGKYQITQKVLASLKKEVKIMHPMPYVDEISPEIRSDPRLIVDQQSWYGIPIRMELLWWGLQSETKKEITPEEEIGEKTIKEAPLDAYLSQRKKKGKKKEKYFRPIRKGTVIDHLPYRSGDIVKRILIAKDLSTDQGVIHIIERVPSEKLGLKDVLVLENTFVSKQAASLVSLVAPQATFNIFRNGMIRKTKADFAKKIFGIGKCPNSFCITNHDPEAKTKFRTLNDKERTIECQYCEREFSWLEIASTI